MIACLYIIQLVSFKVLKELTSGRFRFIVNLTVFNFPYCPSHILFITLFNVENKVSIDKSVAIDIIMIIIII